MNHSIIKWVGYISKKHFAGICYCVFLFIAPCTSNAQFGADYKKAADQFFQKGDYFTAAKYYEKFLGITPKENGPSYTPYFLKMAKTGKAAKKASGSQQEAIYKLAESYRLYNDYGNAEKWYGLAVMQEGDAFPLSRYYYGMSLRANNKLDSAETVFKQFLELFKGDQIYIDNTKNEIANINFIKQQMHRKDIKYYVVNKKLNDVNVDGANYAPAMSNPQTLVFTSTRADTSNRMDALHTNYLYEVSLNNSRKAQRVSIPLNDDMQSGVATFSEDGNTMYFTKWTKSNGKSLSSIYRSRKQNAGWSAPVDLGSTVNLPGFSTQQPFVIPGYLIFSSDRPGGEGRFDLWYASIAPDGTIGTVRNLGPVINSKMDDEAPFYNVETKMLVFASNGRVGMGGFDLYQSKGDWIHWAEPENLGYPINSIKDDIYFIALDKSNLLANALFSSDRASVCCLELFSLNKLKEQKYVTGKVVNCNDGAVISGATVTVEDTIKNTTINSFSTDVSGTYSFVLEEYQPLKLHAVLSGFKEGNIQINEPANLESDHMINMDICMTPIPAKRVINPTTPLEPDMDKPFILKNVYFGFNRSTLKPLSFHDLDSVVSVLKMHPERTLDILGYTDGKGSENYNLELSAARARACLNYIKRHGIPERRLHSQAFGKCCPIESETNADGSDNEEARAKNRRTEFKLK